MDEFRFGGASTRVWRGTGDGRNQPILEGQLFQLDLRSVAGYLKFRVKRLRQVGQALKNVTCLRTSRRRGQAARIEKFVVGVCVMNIGLAFAHVVHHNRSERNRLQTLTLKLDVGYDTLPGHWFVDSRQHRRQVVDEVAQIVEDGTASINLHAMK